MTGKINSGGSSETEADLYDRMRLDFPALPEIEPLGVTMGRDPAFRLYYGQMMAERLGQPNIFLSLILTDDFLTNTARFGYPDQQRPLPIIGNTMVNLG